jgi:hypothetical protein
VVVEGQGPAEVDFHLRAVGLGHHDLVAVSRDVGADVAGLATADAFSAAALALEALVPVTGFSSASCAAVP